MAEYVGPSERARQIIERYSARIDSPVFEAALIEEIACEIGLAELRAIPYRSDIEHVLGEHFWTGEPGQIAAIKSAAEEIAVMFQSPLRPQISVTSKDAAEYVRKERERNSDLTKPAVSSDGFINDYD